MAQSERTKLHTVKPEPALVEFANGPLSLVRLLRGIFFDPLLLWTSEHLTEPMVTVRTPFGARLIVSDPDAIRRVLIENADNYRRDDLQQRIVLRTTGRSLFSAEGDAWRLQRRAMAPFFAPKALAGYLPDIVAAGVAFLERNRSSDAGPIDIHRQMSALTVDVLGRTLFRGQFDELPHAIALNIRRFADVTGGVRLADLLRLPRWLPSFRDVLHRRETRLVRDRSRRVIAANGEATGSVVSALLTAEDTTTGRRLDRGEVEDNIAMLIGAGSDTVALALTWSFVLLAHAPDVRAKVEAEIDRVTDSGALSVASIASLVWCRAVIEEAMRLYPPAPLLGRIAVQGDTLAGRHIAAGTTIMIAPWIVHRHARLWAEPHVFRPERFLPTSREAIPRFAYLPFGAGPRVCAGAGFAMLEAVALLAVILRRIRLDRAETTPIRLRHRLTLVPRSPIQMHIQQRTPAA